MKKSASGEMWQRPTCTCGSCTVCRHRVRDTEWRQRRKRGIPMSAEQKSERARIGAEVRWAKVKEDLCPDVSDEELDRRALANWRPQWNV